MKFSLVICTYKRPVAVCSLLGTVSTQTKKPDEILIIDASEDNSTELAISKGNFDLPVTYVKVPDQHRGLTRQRNYSLGLVNKECDIIAFLDDDLRLEPDYFEELLDTYKMCPDAIGVGGIDLKSTLYFKKQDRVKYSKFGYYEIDGWVLKENLRNKARKLFGLMSDLQPGLIPEYSNGRSTLPPSGQIYLVEHFMGGISTYRKQLFDNIKFSGYFEGYGLYEDFDFCVRALLYGKLYVNTSAKVWHYHEPAGRPDLFKYGKMVIKNGWYVWRLRFPAPSVKARIQWHAIMLLLIIIRLLNVITGPDRKGAFFEFMGRVVAFSGLIFSKPQIVR